MPYDWTQHLSSDRMSRSAGGAVARGGGVFVNTRAPKALRFDPAFYFRWAFDNVINSLQFAETDIEKEWLLELYDVFVTVDEELNYLSSIQKRAVASAESARQSAGGI